MYCCMVFPKFFSYFFFLLDNFSDERRTTKKSLLLCPAFFFFGGVSERRYSSLIQLPPAAMEEYLQSTTPIALDHSPKVAYADTAEISLSESLACESPAPEGKQRENVLSFA